MKNLRLALLFLVCAVASGCYTVKEPDRKNLDSAFQRLRGGSSSIYGVIDANQSPANDAATQAERAAVQIAKGLVEEKAIQFDKQFVVGTNYNKGEVKTIVNDFGTFQKEIMGYLAVVNESKNAYPLIGAQRKLVQDSLLPNVNGNVTQIETRLVGWLKEYEFWEQLTKMLLKTAIRLAEAYFVGGLEPATASQTSFRLNADFDVALYQLSNKDIQLGNNAVSATTRTATLARWKEWTSFLASALETIAKGDVSTLNTESLKAALIKESEKDKDAKIKQLDLIIDTSSDIIGLMMTRIKLSNGTKDGLLEIAKILKEISVNVEAVR